jgi:hypothetical protein
MNQKIHFKKSNDQIMAEIDKKFPIDAQNFDTIVDKVHERYNIVDRKDVEKVVKTLFIWLRRFLIISRSITFSHFLSHAHLLIYRQKIGKGVIYKAKIRNATPPTIKYHDR